MMVCMGTGGRELSMVDRGSEVGVLQYEWSGRGYDSSLQYEGGGSGEGILQNKRLNESGIWR